MRKEVLLWGFAVSRLGKVILEIVRIKYSSRCSTIVIPLKINDLCDVMANVLFTFCREETLKAQTLIQDIEANLQVALMTRTQTYGELSEIKNQNDTIVAIIDSVSLLLVYAISHTD